VSLYLIEAVGCLAALLTTLCWIPQALKILRERQTQGISIKTQTAFAVGLGLWLVYGLALGNVQLIVANAVTLVLAVAILLLKLRYD